MEVDAYGLKRMMGVMTGVAINGERERSMCVCVKPTVEEAVYGTRGDWE